MIDLTVVYYTCNAIPNKFAHNMQEQLLKATEGIPIISVSHIPMQFGNNIKVDLERNHFNIYRQALIGAKEAHTKYIALCEDDVLYSPEHFKRRPKDDNHFTYNLGAWSIFTWGEPMFTHKGIPRKNLNSFICNRELFIEAMEERFDKYPNGTDKDVWAEPGRYENHLGVTIRESEEFFTNPPNIVFSHQTELSFEGLGTRKRVGEFRAYKIPYWGEADKIRSYYV